MVVVVHPVRSEMDDVEWARNSGGTEPHLSPWNDWTDCIDSGYSPTAEDCPCGVLMIWCVVKPDLETVRLFRFLLLWT